MTPIEIALFICVMYAALFTLGAYQLSNQVVNLLSALSESISLLRQVLAASRSGEPVSLELCDKITALTKRVDSL